MLINSQPATAATGINQTINYQGRLLTNTGAVVADGNYNMRFKIYQDGSGRLAGDIIDGATPAGTLKWTETRQNSASQGVVVKNGYFSVQLGSVNAFGASVDWNQDTLWLSMDVTTVGTDTGGSPTYNGELLPMKRLASAVYAMNAGQLGGLASSAFAQLSASQTFTGANIFQPAANSIALTVKQNSQGSPTADILDVQTQNGTAVIQATGPAINESALLLQSVGATRDLTLNSGSGNIVLGSSVTKFTRAGTALSIDLNTAATSTLTVTNSDGSNVANLSVEGIYSSGGTAGVTITACGAGQFLGSSVATKGGLVTAGACATPAGTFTFNVTADSGGPTTVNSGNTVTITGGNGLTSADSSNNITLAVGAGTGITVAADTVLVDQTFSPTWTGIQTFTPSSTNDVVINGDNDSNLQVNSTISSDVGQNGVGIILTDNAAASTAALYGLSVTNADNTTNVGVPDALGYFNNANAAETVVDGVLLEQTGAGTLTNGLEVKQTAGAITNGITLTGTFGTNLIKTPTALLSAAGAWTALTGVTLTSGNITTPGNISTSSSGTITSAGLLTGSAGFTTTGTVQINASGGGTTTIGNSSAGAVSVQGGAAGTTINGTAGTLTLSTTTSGTLAVSSAGALNLSGAAASTLNVGANTLTVTSGGASSWANTSGNLSITTATSGNITVDAFGTLALNGSNFDLATSGVLTLAGGQTKDITTASAGTSTALVFAPGDSTTNSATGSSLTLRGSNQTGTTSTGGNLVLQGGSGTTTAGQVQIGAANTSAVSIATTSNGNISLSPNGTGDVVLTQPAGSQLQVTASAASTVDQVVISNSGQASATNGVDGLVVTFGASSASGDALHVVPSFTSGTTALTYNVLESDAFTATNTTGTDTVNGLKIGALTEAGAGAVTSTALNVGAGWDSVLSVNGNAILGTAGVITPRGVTGNANYVQGDLIYASSTTALSGLADIVAGSCLLSGGVNLAPTWGSCSGAGGLAKNAIDTSAFAVTTAGDAALYKFTNSSSAIASGVLKVDNGNNTGTALFVTGTAGTLLDLQNGGVSKLSVSSAGAVTLAGGQTADITTLAGTAPTALVFQPGNNTSASSTGAAFTLQAGNDSGATTSTGGTLTLKGGDATGSGTKTAGGVTIDSGAAAGGTKGSINIGTAGAAGINLGVSGTTTTVAGNMVEQQNLTINGTYTTTNNTRLLIAGNLNSNAGSQYAVQNQSSFAPTVASPDIYGFVNVAQLNGSAQPVNLLIGGSNGVVTTAGYTGQVTTAYGMQISSPVIGGALPFNAYTGIDIAANSANGGITSGTINNRQINVNGISASAGAGGTLNNYGIWLTQPTGNGGTTNNYGLYIQGNGNGASGVNYSLVNTSTADSILEGRISVGYGALTAPNASYNLDVSGTGRFTGHVFSPDFDAVSGALTVGSANATGITIGKTGSNITTTISGLTVIKPSSGNDSTTALQVQNGAGTPLLTADTTNMQLTTQNQNIGQAADRNTGGRYVSDGFESGSALAWASSGGGGTITYDTGTVHSGKYSAKNVTSGNFTYHQVAHVGTTTVYGREYFDVTSLGNPTLLMDFGTNVLGLGNHLYIYLGASGNLCFNWAAGTSTGCSATAPTQTAWHELETEVIAGGAGTSTLKVWLDGTLVTTGSNALNTTTASFGSTNFVNFAVGGNVSSTATVYYDDVAVDTQATGLAAGLNVNDAVRIGGTTTISAGLILQPTSNTTSALTIKSGSTSALSIQNLLNQSIFSFDVVNKNFSLGSAGNATGQIVFYNGSNGNNVTLQAATTGTGVLTLPAVTGNVCVDTGNNCGFQATGNYLVQGPTTNSGAGSNNIQPVTTGINALTVNGTNTGTAATALVVVQTGAADGVTVAMSNASTSTNGLLVSRGVAGTTTNGLNVTNSTGTTTNGLAITNGTTGTITSGVTLSNGVGGTFTTGVTLAGIMTTGISFGGTTTTGISFGGTNTTDITRTSGVLSMQGTGGVGITAGTTNAVTIDSAGLGSVLLGNANAATVTVGNTGSTTTSIQGNTAINIGTSSTGGTIKIGGTANTGQIDIGNTGNTSAQTITIGTGGTGAKAVTINGTGVATSATTINGGTNNATSTGGAIVLQVGSLGAINIGNTAASKAINIGSTVALAGDSTIAIGTSSSNVQTITIGSTNSTSATAIQGGTSSTAISLTTGANGTIALSTAAGTGNITLTTGSSGTSGTIVKSGTNSTAAFQVQNATTSVLLNVDTINSRTTLGSNSAITSPGGSIVSSTGTNLATQSVTTHTVGNLMIFVVDLKTSGAKVTGVSGGGVTNWTRLNNSTGATRVELWEGIVTSVTTANISATYTDSTPGSVVLAAQEFTAGLGSNTNWNVTASGAIDNSPASGTITYPTLTSAVAGEAYFGFAVDAAGVTGGSSPGFSYNTVQTNDQLINNLTTAAATSYSPTGTAASGISTAVAAIIAASPGTTTLNSNGNSNFNGTTNMYGNVLVGGAGSASAFTIQDSDSTALLTADTISSRIGVNVTYAGMSAPTSPAAAVPTQNATPTVTPTGTTGAVSYGYFIVANTATVTSATSVVGTTATGNATLTAVNYNALAWTAFAGATSYNIYRVSTSGSAVLGLIGTSTTNAFNDTGQATLDGDTSPGLTASSTYRYKVTAIDSAGGETTPSTEVNATTTASAKTINVSWTAVAGASGYNVYRTAAGGATDTETRLTTVTSTYYSDMGTASGYGSVPTADTAYTSTNVSSSSLALSVGGLGTPTGQVYISGFAPKSAGMLHVADGWPLAVAVQGRYAYEVGGTSPYLLEVVDVSNPSSPTEVGAAALGSSTSGPDMVVQGKYAYIVTGSILQIFDVSNPAAPTSVGSVASLGQGLAVEGRYAYVTNSGSTFQVFDISNPANPVSVGSVATAGSASKVVVQGKYAYLSGGTSVNMQVFDISNPAAPTAAGTGGTSGGGNGIAVQGRFAYVGLSGSPDTVKIIDISNPATPNLISSTSTGTTSTSAFVAISVQGRYAYVTSLDAGLFEILDISNPYAPTIVSSDVGNLTSGTRDLAVQGRYAYLASEYDSSVITLDLGGTYSQSLEAGSIESSTLTVNQALSVNQSATIGGSLNVGQSAKVSGDLGVGGSSLFKNVTDSTTEFQVQNSAGATLFVADATNKKIQIGSGATADSTQVLLNLDSYEFDATSIADTATCSGSTNQGALYYNTNTNAIRACVNSAWEDVMTTGGLGIIMFGIVPDSGGAAGAAPGDYQGITAAGAGPCKVTRGTGVNTVRWNGCVAYSGGRKVIIPDQTSDFNTGITTTASAFQNLCLSGTNNQPTFVGTANTTDGSQTEPSFSASSPIVCLATIKEAAGGTQVAQIYDTRTFTTTTKEFVNLVTTPSSPGMLVRPPATAGTAGQWVVQNAAAGGRIGGVVVATAGTTTVNTINAVVATAGPAFVKASAGTGVVGDYLQSTAAAGIAAPVLAVSANGYANLGIALSLFSATACTGPNTDVCKGSIFTVISLR